MGRRLSTVFYKNSARSNTSNSAKIHSSLGVVAFTWKKTEMIVSARVALPFLKPKLKNWQRFAGAEPAGADCAERKQEPYPSQLSLAISLTKPCMTQ